MKERKKERTKQTQENWRAGDPEDRRAGESNCLALV